MLDNNWNRKVINQVEQTRLNNAKIKRLFEEHLGIDFNSIEIPFQQIGEVPFYKFSDFGSLYDNCDFLDIDEEMMHRQYREIDHRLYECVKTLDYGYAEKLMSLGARPDVFLYDGNLEDLPSDESEREHFLLLE